MPLYKYAPPARIFSFLENNLLRFSQPHSLNDAEEALPPIQYGTYAPEDFAAAREEARCAGVINPTENELITLFMTPFPNRRFDEKSFPGRWPAREPRLRPEPFATLEEYDRALALRAVEVCNQYANGTLGILSLSESSDETMWAYYARDDIGHDHAGMAISFDHSHDFFGTATRMEYSHDPIFVTSNQGWVRVAGVRMKEVDILSSKVEGIPPALLMRKKKSWQHEQEWRMIRQLSGADLTKGTDAEGYPVCLFKVPPEAAQSIIFGYRVTDKDISQTMGLIRHSAQWAHLKLFRRKRTSSGVVEEPISLV